MQIAQPYASEHRRLHRPYELRSSQVRAVGIEVRAPPPQVIRTCRRQYALERGASHWIERRRLGQRVGERPQIEPRAADDDDGAMSRMRLREPRSRFVRPPRRGIALGRIDDIDAAVRNTRALGGVRFRGADVETPIDLP